MGYYIDNWASIDKRHLCHKILQLRILVFSYVSVMFMVCTLSVMKIFLNDMGNIGSCNIFEN
jgi:hypothetical protein